MGTGDAVEGMERIGAHHPDTLTAKHNLALLKGSMGHNEEAAQILAERAVSVDPVFFTERDYIEPDDHPITRLDPGRFWLRVYRSAEPEDIGPLTAPVAATKVLAVGWNLCCALARVKGRWRIASVDEVYPNLACTVAGEHADHYNPLPESGGGER